MCVYVCFCVKDKSYLYYNSTNSFGDIQMKINFPFISFEIFEMTP